MLCIVLNWRVNCIGVCCGRLCLLCARIGPCPFSVFHLRRHLSSEYPLIMSFESPAVFIHPLSWDLEVVLRALRGGEFERMAELFFWALTN